LEGRGLRGTELRLGVEEEEGADGGEGKEEEERGTKGFVISLFAEVTTRGKPAPLWMFKIAMPRTHCHAFQCR
jgi:hypothetical protein